MPLLRTRDVIIIPDETVRPPKPKFVVCIAPDLGFFYRINTERWPPVVLLRKNPEHPFLDHDSYLECGDPLEIDDYIVESALDRYGVIGTIHASVCEAVIALLPMARTLREADKKSITEALLRSIADR